MQTELWSQENLKLFLIIYFYRSIHINRFSERLNKNKSVAAFIFWCKLCCFWCVINLVHLLFFFFFFPIRCIFLFQSPLFWNHGQAFYLLTVLVVLIHEHSSAKLSIKQKTKIKLFGICSVTCFAGISDPYWQLCSSSHSLDFTSVFLLTVSLHSKATLFSEIFKLKSLSEGNMLNK